MFPDLEERKKQGLQMEINRLKTEIEEKERLLND